MKHAVCLMLFVCFSGIALGQAVEDSAAAAMDTAIYHYGNSARSDLNVKRDPVAYRRAFRVNTAEDAKDVYNRALRFARTMNTGYKENKKRMVITIPVNWQYKGGFNECIEDLAINASLVLEVKGTKTRISLTDLTYEHYTKDDAAMKPVARTDFFSRHADCAPQKGKVELLYNCTECSRSVKNIDKHFQAQFEGFASEYQEWLKKY